MSHKILLLGGIGEAKTIAQYLIDQQVTVVYSIAGLVRRPQLGCEIRSGGFSDSTHNSIAGLRRYIATNNISLIINATHPYAATMSANAAESAKQSGIPCWRYLRPQWPLEDLVNATAFDTIETLLPLLQQYQRPLFTIGQNILQHHKQRPQHQQWIVRSAVSAQQIEGVTHIDSIGPFRYEEDLALMQRHEVDALITKNSGGNAVAGKLRAAAELAIPVYLKSRPAVANSGDRIFDDVARLCAALREQDSPAS